MEEIYGEYNDQIIRVLEEIIELKQEIPFSHVILKLLRICDKQKIDLEDLEDTILLDVLVDIEADLGIHGTSNFL